MSNKSSELGNANQRFEAKDAPTDSGVRRSQLPHPEGLGFVARPRDLLGYSVLARSFTRTPPKGYSTPLEAFTIRR